MPRFTRDILYEDNIMTMTFRFSLRLSVHCRLFNRPMPINHELLVILDSRYMIHAMSVYSIFLFGTASTSAPLLCSCTVRLLHEVIRVLPDIRHFFISGIWFHFLDIWSDIRLTGYPANLLNK